MKELKQSPKQDDQLLADCIRNLRNIKRSYMTERKFFNYYEDQTSRKDFDYGRKVIKGSLDDQI